MGREIGVSSRKDRCATSPALWGRSAATVRRLAPQPARADPAAQRATASTPRTREPSTELDRDDHVIRIIEP